MKKIILIALVTLLLATGVTASLQSGPAPSSGDGSSDGSGMDNRLRNGEPDVDSQGPSLCSGDGISDGPCWE